MPSPASARDQLRLLSPKSQVIRAFWCTARPGGIEPGRWQLLKGLALSIEMPGAVATLTADIAGEAEAQEQQRELIARLTCVTFAAGAVFFASFIAVLIQLQ
jgi:hypothetical protein